jgi:hypothetical protein
MPNTYFARASGRIAPHRSTTQGRTLALVLLGIGVAIGACSNPPPLDQAIKCDQFKRLPDASWSTTADVSLDFMDNGTHYQDNFGKGVTISASGHNAVIVAALEKKCDASK